MSGPDEKKIEQLYALLHEKEQSDPDVAASLRWAIFNLEQQDRQQQPTDIISRKEYLELWGLLEILKTDFEQKARTAAQRGDEIGDKTSAEYLRQAAATQEMQWKINTKAMNMPE